jgi:DNA-binding CsgD family transcriptional regulator
VAGKNCLIGMGLDVTDRKRVEGELVRVREELEGKVELHMRGDDNYGLTFRERTVLNLVAAGRSDKEIALTLGIRPLTASSHVGSILGKMGAVSRAEVSARAVREAARCLMRYTCV